MDLFDIFTSAEKAARPKDIRTKSDGPRTIEEQARDAAAAFDDTMDKETRYKLEYDRRMAEVESQLAGLKRDYDAARAASEAAAEDLLKAMDAAGITSIPMADRKSIEIKVTAGRKKNITKKWLTDEFGSQQANSIWDKVPTGPDKRDLVIPPRFQDEPND